MLMDFVKDFQEILFGCLKRLIRNLKILPNIPKESKSSPKNQFLNSLKKNLKTNKKIEVFFDHIFSWQIFE
jgi:hypothetical protein